MFARTKHAYTNLLIHLRQIEGRGGAGKSSERSDRDKRHQTGGEEGRWCRQGRAVAVDEGFLGVGRWNEDKCHRSSILS
jgi:hypothetical protein